MVVLMVRVVVNKSVGYEFKVRSSIYILRW